MQKKYLFKITPVKIYLFFLAWSNLKLDFTHVIDFT